MCSSDLASGPEGMEILDIGVLPEFRRRGVATEVVKRLQESPSHGARPIGIFIESFNSADSLFRDLGFRLVRDDGGLRRFEWTSGL